jgi:hypothetical protein
VNELIGLLVFVRCQSSGLQESHPASDSGVSLAHPQERQFHQTRAKTTAEIPPAQTPKNQTTPMQANTRTTVNDAWPNCFFALGGVGGPKSNCDIDDFPKAR